jgi:hypothetical protein
MIMKWLCSGGITTHHPAIFDTMQEHLIVIRVKISNGPITVEYDVFNLKPQPPETRKSVSKNGWLGIRGGWERERLDHYNHNHMRLFSSSILLYSVLCVAHIPSIGLQNFGFLVLIE